jgi:hypothetical protein
MGEGDLFPSPHVIEAATSGTYLPLTGAGIVVGEISDDAQADGNGRAQSAPTKAERAARRTGWCGVMEGAGAPRSC